ncbi:uncharacterized protein LOC143240405 isoform X2 [Tachypleus tridentatus]|uniref:uncharacterized protein LOC143240405 isoform X2 n=1 Tax=Tachypleus tridentatus TaxID=6853 RepID=UPI003FD47151
MLTFFSCFSFDCFFHSVPLLWLMSMPFFGAVWGESVVIQQCLITFVLIASGSVVPPVLRKWIPCIDSFLLMILLSWPYQILPNCFIWLTSQFFWLVEPIIQGIEAFTLVTGTCFLSEKAVEVIDYQPMFGKALVLTAAGVAYIFSCVVICQLLLSESTALYCERDKSFMRLLLDLPEATTAFANQPLKFARLLFGPVFWITVLVRTTLVIYFVQHFLYNKEEEDLLWPEGVFKRDLLERLLSSQTVLKMAAVMVYTQAICYRLHGDWPVEITREELGLKDVGLTRVSQSFSLGFMYLWLLFCEHDVNDSW